MDPQTLMMVVLLALVGGMLYLSSRSRKKQVAAQQQKMNSIVPGVRVMTIAGLQGTVVDVDETTIELEIAPGVHTTWLRTAVRDILTEPTVPDDISTVDADEDTYSGDTHKTDGYESVNGRDDTTKKDLG